MYKIQTLNAISDIIHTQLNENYAISKEETRRTPSWSVPPRCMKWNSGRN